MAKEDKKNYFVFLGVYFLSFLTLNIPDIDQAFLGLLGHRSIITHSILFPYLLYHFFIKKKDKPNDYLIFFVIGFYISIAIHLSADLHPKGWRGTANIKLPGNNSIGEGLSIIWMSLNVIVGTYFSSRLLINISNTKKYLIPYVIVAALIAGIYTAEDGGDEEKKAPKKSARKKVTAAEVPSKDSEDKKAMKEAKKPVKLESKKETLEKATNEEE